LGTSTFFFALRRRLSNRASARVPAPLFCGHHFVPWCLVCVPIAPRARHCRHFHASVLHRTFWFCSCVLSSERTRGDPRRVSSTFPHLAHLVHILYALATTYAASQPLVCVSPRLSHVHKDPLDEFMFWLRCGRCTARTNAAAALRAVLGMIWAGPPAMCVFSCHLSPSPALGFSRVAGATNSHQYCTVSVVACPECCANIAHVGVNMSRHFLLGVVPVCVSMCCSLRAQAQRWRTAASSSLEQRLRGAGATHRRMFLSEHV
jgi:hypothetical protein